MPHIELHDVSKAFPLTAADSLIALKSIIFGHAIHQPLERAKVAIDRVSLKVGAGESVGIIGRNGAGKSTLLHLIAGIADPTAGTVVIEGHVTSVLTLGVGLREDLTGRENIYVDGALQGKSREEVDVTIRDIIEFAELGEFIDRPIRTYSTGMKARLAFSMIAFIDPEILLIDEALSVGDAQFSKKATRRIREICAKGRVVVVVSHSLTAIKEICTRCLWMDAGRVIMDGAPLEVTEAYAKAIQESDQKVLLAKFHKHVQSTVLKKGWAVETLDAWQGSAPQARSTLSVDNGFIIRWCVRQPSGEHGFELRLLIERMDGLLIADERFECNGDHAQVERVEQAMEIPQLLAHGIYRVELNILKNGETAACRSSVFEITNLVPPTGGRPVLHYPHTIGLARIV